MSGCGVLLKILVFLNDHQIDVKKKVIEEVIQVEQSVRWFIESVEKIAKESNFLLKTYKSIKKLKKINIF